MKNVFFTLNNALKQVYVFSIACLVFWTFCRAVYVFILYFDRVHTQHVTNFVFAQGVRFDLVILGMIIVLPGLLSILLSPIRPVWKPWQTFQSVYFSTFFGFIVLMELATPSFIEQYDVRPNILFIEYLKYPKEVFSMLSKGYLTELLLVLVLVPISSFGFYMLVTKRRSSATGGVWASLIIAPFALLIFVLMIRSTLGHRPVNPSNVAVTPDLMVNSLTLNSTYSALYALYAHQSDNENAFTYGQMQKEKVLNILQDEMRISKDDFLEKDKNTLHKQVPRIARSKPLNLVILLQESLGAEFVGTLGGLPLTPNIDALSKEGIWFENLYATGTRSVRGIEAVITGFTPTPNYSVVKLQNSQSNFFTIAELLKRHGYDTSFIYGGEAHFDNMRGFFVGNGFETIIEQKDYENPKFVGSWGVSDEDLLDKAHETFSKQGDRPFFSLVFSSSNHSPFEYPENTIVPYDSPFATVNNAVKYADHAIGRFIAKAKTSNYWHNTLFVIVADHNSRVYGPDLVPIERFHVPGLILGADAQPKTHENIVSQIDLVPTLFSLIGVEAVHPAIGLDVLRPDLSDFPGRAIMQYHDTQAYMEGNDVVVFQRDKQPELYRYLNNVLTKQTADKQDLITRALAYSLFGTMAYNEGLYSLPTKVVDQ